VVGTEVVEHSATVVEQRLDVNELQLLMVRPEYALAEFKTQRTFQVEPARPFKILRARRPKDAGRLPHVRREEASRSQAFPDEHFAEFRPSVGANHHSLPALESG
jgi:hypothetical protein